MLRLLEEQGRFLAEILEFRQAGSYDAALFTVLRAQERLFARPAQDFLPRSLEEQLHLLVVGESENNARDKCLAHAALLAEAGHTYKAKGQLPLALGAYQLALQVTLVAAAKLPPTELSALGTRIAALRDQLPPEALNADVKELLRQLASKA